MLKIRVFLLQSISVAIETTKVQEMTMNVCLTLNWVLNILL